MNITIVKTVKGSEDGLHLRQYDAGQSYTVTDRLARNLIAGGYAVETPEKGPEAMVSREQRAPAKRKRR